MQTHGFRKGSSLVGYGFMVGSLAILIFAHHLLSRSWPGILCQIAAVLLMIWARIIFGKRSFHLSAETTPGGLVTQGPYAVIRHPIYAAVLLFAFAGMAGHFSGLILFSAIMLLAGVFLRIWSEEQFLLETYPEYRGYRMRTKRVIPFLF